jgi:hypothetical protein
MSNNMQELAAHATKVLNGQPQSFFGAGPVTYDEILHYYTLLKRDADRWLDDHRGQSNIYVSTRGLIVVATACSDTSRLYHYGVNIHTEYVSA